VYAHVRTRERVHYPRKKRPILLINESTQKYQINYKDIMGLSGFKYRLYGSHGEPINEADALGPRLTLFSHTAIASAEHLRIRSITQIISDHKIGT